MAKTVKKQLVFSEELLTKGESRARKYGISFGEYLRYLILRDVEKDMERGNRDYVSNEIEESIGIALKDVRRGEYGVLDSQESIERFVDSLNEN